MSIAAVVSVLAPVVRDLVIELVEEIRKSPDPEGAARRAIEAARVSAFDESMRRRD